MDGTENLKDTSVATQDTSEGDKGTSKKESETFTRETQEASNQKARDDALSAAGRTATILTKREEAVQASEERIVEAQKARDEAELEDARDDVDKTTRLKAQQKHRETVTELAQVKRELKEEKGRTAESEKKTAVSTKEISTREIATRLEVDENSLTDLIKFTDGSTEAIEAMAQTLPKKGKTETLLVDSSKTIGGTQELESANDKMLAGLEKVFPQK